MDVPAHVFFFILDDSGYNKLYFYMLVTNCAVLALVYNAV